MKQAEINELARIARLTGKCIQCGEDTGTDKKGINFVNCAIHREAISRKRRPAHFALPKKRDFDPDYCMFDTKEWRQFCVEVSAAARDVRSITIRGLLNELDARGIDREFSERHIHDAIEWILATGTIRRCWGELPSRYERSDRTPLELRKRQFNGAIKPPQIKEPDHDSIYA